MKADTASTASDRTLCSIGRSGILTAKARIGDRESTVVWQSATSDGAGWLFPSPHTEKSMMRFGNDKVVRQLSVLDAQLVETAPV